MLLLFVYSYIPYLDLRLEIIEMIFNCWQTEVAEGLEIAVANTVSLYKMGTVYLFMLR